MSRRFSHGESRRSHRVRMVGGCVLTGWEHKRNPLTHGVVKGHAYGCLRRCDQSVVLIAGAFKVRSNPRQMGWTSITPMRRGFHAGGCGSREAVRQLGELSHRETRSALLTVVGLSPLPSHHRMGHAEPADCEEGR